MQRICLSFYLAVMGLVGAGCGFLNSPENFGELQINFDFSQNNSTLAKASDLSALQVVNRVVVVMFEYTPDVQRLPDREIVRKEFRLDANRQLRATIQVPLRAGVNCFFVSVQAFDGARLLYAASDFPCFDDKNKRVVANIQLRPTAFSIVGESIGPTLNRTVTISGFAPDTSVTDIEIAADSVTVKFPVLQNRTFNNPAMLFGDKTLIRISAYSGTEFRGEVRREVTYTGRKADVLIALVWDQPIDLDLEVLVPGLQLPISVSSRGDSVDGTGRLQIDDQNGYGPEIYEWRSTRINIGPFVIRVARQRLDLQKPASGRVYFFFKEAQLTPSRRIAPFEFKTGDILLTQNDFNFTWPIQ